MYQQRKIVKENTTICCHSNQTPARSWTFHLLFFGRDRKASNAWNGIPRCLLCSATPWWRWCWWHWCCCTEWPPLGEKCHQTSAALHWHLFIGDTKKSYQNLNPYWLHDYPVILWIDNLKKNMLWWLRFVYPMTRDLHEVSYETGEFQQRKPTCKCNNDSLYSSQCWDNKLPKQIMLNDLPVLSFGTNWQLQVAEKFSPPAFRFVWAKWRNFCWTCRSLGFQPSSPLCGHKCHTTQCLGQQMPRHRASAYCVRRRGVTSLQCLKQ